MKRKVNQKTRAIQIVVGEMYWVRHEYEDGIRWEAYIKDKSGLCKAWHDTKFKSQGGLSKHPVPYSEKPGFPIQSSFETDLLGPYAAHEYAEGHKPAAPLRLW